MNKVSDALFDAARPNMNWDDPAARGRLIESVGVNEYNRLIQQHFKNTTVAVENGYPIRAVNTHFGRIFMVDGTNKGHGARRSAESLGGRAMIDWKSMTEDEIRQELKDAGIEPIGVEVDSGTLTVWVSGTRKDREGRLVPRKFVARRLETVVRTTCRASD